MSDIHILASSAIEAGPYDGAVTEVLVASLNIISNIDLERPTETLSLQKLILGADFAIALLSHRKTKHAWAS